MTKIDKKVLAQQATSVKKTQEKAKTQKAASTQKATKTKATASQQSINNIAQGLYDAARKYSGAVGKEEFSNLLKKINKNNIVGVINRYNNVLSPDESIVEMILDEYLSSTKDMKEALIGEGDEKNAIRGIFTNLVDRAKEVGVDSQTLSTYKTQFDKILDGELRGVAFARTSKQLDEIISTVIQSIDNQVAAKATKTQVSPEQSSWLELGAINILSDRNSSAVSAFNKYLKNEKASERMAEGFSKIWGSKNTKTKVKADIEANQKQIADLKKAAKEGDTAFRAKFLEIFGVAYNPTNIRAYQDAQKLYQDAAKSKSDEDSFKSAFSLLLKGNKLQEEGTNVSASTTGATYYKVTKSKADVLKREFNNMAKMFDSVVKADADNFAKAGIKSGADFLNKKFEAANAKSDDAKYAVLSDLAKQISQGLENATKKACGGRSFDAVQKQYDNCYKAAYGLNNDIQKRVNDYVDSQIKGGGYVKMIGTMATVMAVSAITAGAGAAAGVAGAGKAAATSASIGAATFAGTKFVVDVADNFSTPELREILRKEGVKAFLEKGSKATDWKGITVGALQGGAMCLMFAGQSYAVTNLVAKAGSAIGASATATGYAAAGANALGITALGLGTEYLLTGEISVEGAIFTVVMAVTTAGIQVMQINKAAAQAKAQAEAALNERIYNARHTLGFEDGVEVTSDGLKAQFRKLSIQYHPDKGGTEAQMAIINDAYNTLQANIGKINSAAVFAVAPKVVPEAALQPAVQPAAETPANPSGVTTLATPGDAIVIPMPQSQNVIGAAAASSGPAATGETTGLAARVQHCVYSVPIDNGFMPSIVYETMEYAKATVESLETTTEQGVTVTYGKDANGNNAITNIKNGIIEASTYVEGNLTVQQTMVGGKYVGSYISEGEEGVYIDANGKVVTEEAYGEAITKATTEAYEKITPPKTEGTAAPKLDAQTQQAINDGLIRMEYVNEVENALTNSKTQNVVRNTMLKAKTQAELQYFADKFKNSDSVIDRYNALQAEAYKDQLPVKPSDDTLGIATGQRLLPEGEAAAAAGKEPAITVPEGTTVEEARAKIAKLQKELKAYGAGTDRYDQIHMDRIQEQIKAYREIAPLDRTNLEEVLLASPDEVFEPVKADNIKGQGISFKPYVPEDPEALAKVTYRAVPLYTEARTVEEMIRIAARDGIKIEMVQDENGNYFPGVKSIWSEGAYFKLDRDSYVVQYGEIPADDPYVDQAWAQQNKYVNAEGKEVIMDCAIVAADKSTAADIMPHSYVKASGAQLSASDKYNWNGFQAHKDPDGVVNAVAYDSPQELQTLEGKITTDVTMGDVEGNVYNKFKDLKKQIMKDKLVANPEDPNSQKFIDLVKAGKDDEAIALLREATKASQAGEQTASIPVTAESAPSSAPKGGQSAETIKSAIADAKDIDSLRALRDQIKGVKDKAVAQELREAYVQKEQALREALPPEVKNIENMYRPGTNEHRDRVLTKAGFSQGVIDDLVAQGPWGDPRLDAQLVDELLNMVVFLEGEVSNGAKITRSLVEKAISTFSPGSSGSSASIQLSLLANYWTRGTEVYNAFGQKAPEQSTFSVGNLKAKWNKAKNTVKNFYEDIKFELNIEDKTSSAKAYEQAKTELYTQWDSDKLINEFNARFNYGVKEDQSIIRAILTSRGYAPNENGYYEATIDVIPTHVAQAQSESSLSPQLTNKLLEALAQTKIGDASVVTDMIAKHPDFVQKLSEVMTPDGKPLFDAKNIDLVLANLTKVIENNPERIWAVLSNTEEVLDIASWKSPAAGLWNAVQEPLSSTAKANSEVIGVKPAPAPVTNNSVPAANGETAVSKSSPLGESLTNPSFPTKFSKSDFKAWADANGLTLEIKDGIALFKDADGNTVRRITNDWNHKGQVYDDHVILYENGEEVAKFIKYTDEKNVRFYYNFDGDRYIGKAELRPDGQWYNSNTGERLNESPVAVKPQAKAAAPKAQTSGTVKSNAAPVMQNSVAKCEIPVNMPRISSYIGNVLVTIAGGDMTGIKADAYVVTEFTDCASEGGVGGAIARRGAAGGLKAYQQYVDQNGELEFGDVVVTESGGGQTSHLIHAVTAGADENISFEVVQKATYNALKAAQSQGMQSVVFPAMGTGIIGSLTNEQSAQAIMAGINQFAKEGGKMDVSVVVYSTGQGFQDFNHTLLSKSYENAKPVVGAKEFDEGAFVAEFAQTLAEEPVSSSNAPAAKVVGKPDTTLDLTKAGRMTFEEFFEECKAYAKDNDLIVIHKTNGFGNKISFSDKSGHPVRELQYIGDALFDDTYYTYNEKGQLKTENRYIAEDGRYADTIEYFYDENGNRTYSLKFDDDKQIDVAVWKDGKGTRMGQGVFYTAEQVKSKFGLDIDKSAFGTKAADAEAKLSGTGTKAAAETPAAQSPAQEFSGLPNGVSSDFALKFARARSIQDLEDMVTFAETKEECQYLIDKLDNPQTKAVNGSQIESVINSAKQKIRLLEYQGTEPKTLATGLKEDLVAEFENLNYDTKIVADMIEKYPDLVDKLASYKTSDGKPLFSPIDIDDILYNCRGTIQKDPQLLIAELDKPGTVDNIATWSNRSYALIKRVPHYEANKTVAAQPAPKAEEPKSIYDKANQYVKDEEGYPQWLTYESRS